MKEIINHSNYEDYFLLYVDEELDAAEKKAVELFVVQYPDLRPVLEALLQTKTTADASIVFPGKSVLLHKAPLITDEAILLYLDGEPVDENIEMALQNPTAELQQRMELFKKTIVAPDASLVFPDKSTLYRQVKVLRFYNWKSITATAALLLLIIGYGWFNWQKKPASVTVASVSPHPAKAATDTPGRGNQVVIPDPGSARIIAGVPPVQKATALKQKRVPKNLQTPDPPGAQIIVPVPNQQPAAAQPGILPAPPDIPAITPAQEGIATSVRPEINTDTRTNEELAKARAVPGSSAKEKKSIFKKLIKRIEDRVADSFDEGADQVTVAGFAFNVKQRR